jgi:hypothetical protein
MPNWARFAESFELHECTRQNFDSYGGRHMDRVMTDEEWEAPLDEETERQITEALANARDPYDYEVAVSAEYDRSRELLLVKLKSGQWLAIPREDLQDLADEDPDKVSKVELEMLGMSLHWEELDVDFRVDGLRQGLYGNERWMKQLEQRRRENAAAALSQTA